MLNYVNTLEAKLRLVPYLRENFGTVRKLRLLLEIGIDVVLDKLGYIKGFLSNTGRL